MKVGRSSRKYYLDVTFASFLSIQHFVGDLSVCKLPYFPQSHRLFVKYSCNDPFIVCQISQKDSEGLVCSKITSWVWSLRVDYFEATKYCWSFIQYYYFMLELFTISRIVESGAKHHKPNHFPPCYPLLARWMLFSYKRYFKCIQTVLVID
jgi:hypothetical protein